ncbi:hypothetical protein BXP70_10030 [Hymenobacter crusticola]|uniref:Glycosyltransferase RgtA/B/C/D-like domain-containing protein n=1 Tax=Hymenobacter crusticola TaxID=1770526 RepID=A0A243WGJ6_9BACT|nr:hypothetical protein BXP70_10030 [Hymenobacter crusticola]
MALVTLIGLIVTSYWLLRLRRNNAVPAKLPRLFVRADWPWLIGVTLLGTGLWTWGALYTPPTHDEVFSALYCAGNESLFVTWSYYMLPNNHVLFNLLNGSMFGWLHHLPWLVTTGRILSGLAYLGTLAVVYWLMGRFTGRRWAGAGAATLASLQYSLWGFGFQARGYALYALLHWIALAALLGYWRQPRRAWLMLNAGAIVAGYATVPTFLFYHAAQLAAAVIVQVRLRRYDGRFWLAQGGALVLAGGFYLPAVGFSGLAAISANPYVRPFQGSLAEFITQTWPDFKSYASYCFGEMDLGPWPAYVLALVPLSLLAHRRFWQLGLVYAAWLLVLVGGILGLRHIIFHRNLLGLFSVALVLAPFTVGVWLARWRSWAGLGGVLLIVGGLGVGLVRHNPVSEPTALYFYDLEGGYAAVQQRLSALPDRWASVAFLEESFYPYWMYVRDGGVAPHPAQRPTPAADYFITAPNDRLPGGFIQQYAPVDTVNGYRLFRRRTLNQ